MPMAVQTACTRARARWKRVMGTKAITLRMDAIGSKVWSARGANRRELGRSKITGAQRGGAFHRRVPHEHATGYALEHGDPTSVECHEVVLARVPPDRGDCDPQHQHDRDHPERDASPLAPMT